MFSEKMDRSKVVCSTQELLDDEDYKYWSNATPEEKLQTITYLRECFMEKPLLPEDFKDFIQCLNSNKVKYLLIGRWVAWTATCWRDDLRRKIEFNEHPQLGLS